MRRHAPYFLGLAILVSAVSSAAAQTGDFYSASFVVTGQGEPNRLVGFRETFARVLVKVSGDQTILDDSRFPAVASTAPTLVTDFRYRDLLEGKPLHDEQGSYDRPHALTVVFEPARVNAALGALGRKPWLGQRPRLFVVLGIQNIRASFVLTQDGDVDRSADMRAAFAAAGERMGVAVAFPTIAQLQARGITAKTVGRKTPGDITPLTQQDDIAIVGHMLFSEAALGWIAAWRMDHEGKIHRWKVRGVNFDAAFRHAVFGAAQIFSGNGEPK